MFRAAWTWLQNRLRREEGQAMVEYGLILALVAVFVIGAIVLLRDEIAAVFNDIVTGLGNR